jgi:hypothetical protein
LHRPWRPPKRRSTTSAWPWPPSTSTSRSTPWRTRFRRSCPHSRLGAAATRRDPPCKPLVSGWAWTPAGPWQVTLMLDTGASHCIICAELARALQLPASATPGPTTVTLTTPDASRTVPPPVVVHLALGNLREVVDMSPLDLGPDLDIILGWDWISSHDLSFLYQQGRVTGTGPTARYQLTSVALPRQRRRPLSLSATASFVACSAAWSRPGPIAQRAPRRAWPTWHGSPTARVASVTTTGASTQSLSPRSNLSRTLTARAI